MGDPLSLVGIIAQENGTNTTLALSDENRSEGALAYGKAYFCIRATSAIVRRRHTEYLIRFIALTFICVPFSDPKW